MNLYYRYFRKYWLPFLAAIFCVTSEAVCDSLAPTLMSNIINMGIAEQQISQVYYWGVRMLLVTFLGACFAVARNILASKVSQRMGADLRYDLFEKIIYFSEQSVDKIESGSLITRMTNDTSQVIMFVNGIMRIFLKAPITCIGSTGTIMDNIRYARQDATDEEVIRAAKIARAHDFIIRLPNGYNTMVSGAADNLSQGQRQLIAIARAVLCDSPVLILDEATSSVDTKTEKDIQRALLSLMKDRTSFLIAHRLSTIMDADRIFVISDGRIVESGNHESLMNRKGLYYQMVISQTGNMAS